MTVKDVARQVIDTLPDEADMDDIMHALYVRTAFERGLQEIREGRGIPQAEVEKRLQKWVK